MKQLIAVLVLLCAGSVIAAGGNSAGNNFSGDMATGNAAAGKALFDSVCQTCHGEEGAGDGPGAAEFVLRPRPFSQAAFKFDTDSDWEKGSDVDLANVIKNGATAYGGSMLMPAWPALSDKNVADLVAFIRSVGQGVSAGTSD